MNRSSVLVAAVVAVVFGAVIVVQAQRNAALRESVSSLQKEVAALKEQTERERHQTAELSKKNEVFESESADLRKQLAAAGGNARDPASKGDAATGGGPGGNRDGSFMKGFAKMFTDPENKKAMRGQQSMVVRMMYADLAKDLGLSAEEANQVMEILTERQMAMAEGGMALMGGDASDPAKVEASRKAIEQSRKDYDAQLQSLLGDERGKKFTEYERSVGDRMQLQQFQQALTAAGVPLQDSQRDGLIAIMKEERANMPPSPFQAGNQNTAAQIKAMQTGEGIDEAMRQMEQFNARVLPRARTLLTPEQANSFEAAQKQQLEMMQLGLKMSREMFKK